MPSENDTRKAPDSIQDAQYFYRGAAVWAQEDPLRPREEWLIAFLRRLLHTQPKRFAQRVVSAMRRYFLMNRVPDALAEPLVAAVLAEATVVAVNPGALPAPLGDASNDDPLFDRMKTFHKVGISDSFERCLRLNSRRWEEYAHEKQFQPMSPTPEHVAAFLCLQAETKTVVTVKLAAICLRHYFEACGAQDVTQSFLVKQTILGIARAKPGVATTTLYLQDVRQILKPLGDRPCDIRNRLLILCCYLGGLTTGQVVRLDRSQCLITSNSVELGPVAGFRKTVSIGTTDDPDFDVVRWLRRWLEIVGTSPGPLFVGTHCRGGLRDEWMCHRTVSLILRRIANHAGLNVTRIGPALRNGFAVEGVEKIGMIATAQHLGYKTLSQLKKRVPKIGLAEERLRLLMGTSIPPRWRWTRRRKSAAIPLAT